MWYKEESGKGIKRSDTFYLRYKKYLLVHLLKNCKKLIFDKYLWWFLNLGILITGGIRMDGKRKKSNFKHIDFIILDIICLQASFVLSYWILHAGGNPYIIDSFRYQAGLLLLSQLIVILFTNGYSGILRRKKRRYRCCFFRIFPGLCRYRAGCIIQGLRYHLIWLLL